MKKTIIAISVTSVVIVCMTMLMLSKKDTENQKKERIDDMKISEMTDESVSDKAVTEKIKIQTDVSSDKVTSVTETEILQEPSSDISVQTTQPVLQTEQQPVPQPEPELSEQPTVPYDEPVSPQLNETEFYTQILTLVNNERMAAGLPELSGNDLLNQAAQIRASEIADNFSHTRPNGESCYSVIGQLGISAMTMGENIAAGSSTAEGVMNQWMNSEKHRENILNPSFTSLGVGFIETSGGYHYYWTQMFTG